MGELLLSRHRDPAAGHTHRRNHVRSNDADLATARSATRRRPRARLRPTPDAPAVAPVVDGSAAAGLSTSEQPASATPAFSDAPTRAAWPGAGGTERPLTVTISIDGGGQEGRERILVALRDLVEAVGGDPVVALSAPVTHRIGLPGGARPGIVNLDPKPRAAFRDGSLLDLSRLEYDLLLFFAENPRQVFSRAQLLERVWGHVHTGARTVDVHISRLRNKLDDHELITTVYGVGYRLADGAPVQVV